MILGIMGGMGPAATCDLFKRITDLTPATKDQEHLHIIIDSNVEIPDRTAYILGIGQDPMPEMIKSIRRLEMMGVDYIAIPCNTAHYFYNEIIKYTKTKILNMIYETGSYLKANFEHKNYLLLATKGTYKVKIYKNIFGEFNLNIIEPDTSDQELIMDWIYNVKSSKFNVNTLEFQNLVSRYTENKEIPIILGCTELPILVEKIGVLGKYIDPVSILAKRCIELAKDDLFIS
ncbi:aspartate/glutamate racemase family protein [Tissierella praeacuta]|uniref:Aspartate racemase n=1 Tax=Tissierella praeacuta DSM 18095 TaxID=1123404 RepID=A0A1M4VP57_9FIRM|nr:amino acid racemase [Tissierella praeacuta]HAE91320.1 aspartate racemase [Tissierella sp.]MBU5256535.1 amino acid racemase [Tissierella praeacuta]TCU79357.1 aspartate racemase [Tissierella praeacuta]SHE70623.1 aspartate racemase [Tissierella praeacuta DSM 18095]SUO98996.1 Aspartate racemase [Tissierella praeacuta]